MPQFIRQDVQDAKELTLVVGFGRYTDVRSRVNWADARLIKVAAGFSMRQAMPERRGAG